MPKEYEWPQGLRPGMPNPGAFRRGDDARRVPDMHPRRLPNGKTLASLAREYTEQSVALLVQVITGQMPDCRVSDQIRSAEILLDRGWGKAVSVVDMQVTHERSISSLSRTELLALASGEVPSVPITIEGEVITASVTARPSDNEVSV